MKLIILFVLFIYLIYLLNNTKIENFNIENFNIENFNIDKNINTNRLSNKNNNEMINISELISKTSSIPSSYDDIDLLYKDTKSNIYNYNYYDETHLENTNIHTRNYNFPKEIFYNDNNYNLFGYIFNKYYNQYFILYEYEMGSENLSINTILNIPTSEKYSAIKYNKQIKKNQLKFFYTDNDETKYLVNKLYKYLLVKIENKIPKIIYNIGPRDKINTDDIVYFSHGVIEIGPLFVKSL